MAETNRKFGEASGSDQAVLASPDIPELRKKEKERKGTGAPLIARGSGAVNVVGAVGRSGTGSGFLGAGRLASLLSEALGGSSTSLGALFASQYGPMLAALGALSAAGGLAAAGYSLHEYYANRPSPTAAEQQQAFDAPANTRPSSVSRSRANPSSLFYINKNELENAPELAAPAPEEKTEEKKAGVEAKPETLPAQPAAPAAAPLRREFIKKMSTDMKDFVSGGSVGNRLQNSLNSAVPKFEDKLSKNKLAALEPALKRAAATNVSVQRGVSSRAMGQLKLAKNMSSFAASGPAESSRGYAADAFDQRKSLGTFAPGLTSIGSDTIVPPGKGAPDSGSGVGPGQNVTPYQDQIDNAQNQGNQAAGNKTLGMVLLGLGAALLMMGIMLMQDPPTEEVGTMLLMMGIGLLVSGAMALAQANQQQQRGRQNAQNVQNKSGQHQQANAMDDCLRQAAENGTPIDKCQTQPVEIPHTSVREDVHREMDQNYHF